MRCQQRVTKGRHHSVSETSLFDDCTPNIFSKTGQHQQPPFLKGFMDAFIHDQVMRPFCRAKDYRLSSPQQQVKTFFLHGGMETAANDNSPVPQSANKVKGLDDDASGALNGADQPDRRLIDYFRITDGENGWGRGRSHIMSQPGRISGIILIYATDFHVNKSGGIV